MFFSLNSYKYLLILLSLSFLQSCKKSNPEKMLFQLMGEDYTNISFVNKLSSDFDNNILEYDYFYNGSGVGAADFNNDGLTDLFFASNQSFGKLYLNKGNLKFEDITNQSGIVTKGWGTGVSLVDINQDGWVDIYLCNAGLKHLPNQFFINQGKQANGQIKFVEMAKQYGVDYSGFSTQAAFFDYDRDGDLDMYLLNHFHEKINPNYPRKKVLDGSAPSNDKLFRNEGKCFTEVSKQAGIKSEGYGLGISIADLNQDGWQDIYVSNDFAFDDLSYINNKDGTFTENAKLFLKHTSRFSMGCDIADFNNDLLPDIFVADMLPDDNKRQKTMGTGVSNETFNFSLSHGYIPQYSRNTLQLNNGRMPSGELSFSEIGQLAGVYKTDWSWSALFGDLDNDGWKDIFISNGIPKDITNLDFTAYRSQELSKENLDYNNVKGLLLAKVEQLKSAEKPDYIFKNNGNLTFINQSSQWGIKEENSSNGALMVDLDNDGDLEIVTNNINKNVSLYKNNSNEVYKNNYIDIKLSGHYAEGATVKVIHGGKAQMIGHNIYRSFQSTQEDIIHFGLGKDSIIESLEILWPDGKYQRLINVKANKRILIYYRDAKKREIDFFNDTLTSRPILREITAETGINFFHKENDFEDFNFEPLLPHRFSQNGPKISSGDVDGNGLEDFWVGGPAMIAGKIFFQQINGTFEIKDMPDKGYEDQEGLFFDADNDKDLDLYVVSGGDEYNPLTATYQDRLYFNDGKGNFVRRENALPIEFSSGSCVKGCDFDKDGDIDLFVGGQGYSYPIPAPPRKLYFTK